MQSSNRRSLLVAGAAALMIGGSAAASAFIGNANTDMSITINTPAEGNTIVTTTTTASSSQPEHTIAAAYHAAEKSTVYTEIISVTTAGTNDAEELTVYVSSTGRYHTRSDCSGMKTSTPMDISQAQAAGNAPCAHCFESISPAAEPVQQATAPDVVYGTTNVVYVSKTGKYHARSDCSGMKTSTPMELADAKAAGHEPCQKCY